MCLSWAEQFMDHSENPEGYSYTLLKHACNIEQKAPFPTAEENSCILLD